MPPCCFSPPSNKDFVVVVVVVQLLAKDPDFRKGCRRAEKEGDEKEVCLFKGVVEEVAREDKNGKEGKGETIPETDGRVLKVIMLEDIDIVQDGRESEIGSDRSAHGERGGLRGQFILGGEGEGR